MGICGFLEVWENELSGYVNKECAGRVAAKRPMTVHHVGESRAVGDHLIDTAHFAGSKRSLTNRLGILKGTMLCFSYWHSWHKGGEHLARAQGMPIFMQAIL